MTNCDHRNVACALKIRIEQAATNLSRYIATFTPHDEFASKQIRNSKKDNQEAGMRTGSSLSGNLRSVELGISEACNP